MAEENEESKEVDMDEIVREEKERQAKDPFNFVSKEIGFISQDALSDEELDAMGKMALKFALKSIKDTNELQPLFMVGLFGWDGEGPTKEQFMEATGLTEDQMDDALYARPFAIFHPDTAPDKKYEWFFECGKNFIGSPVASIFMAEGWLGGVAKEPGEKTILPVRNDPDKSECIMINVLAIDGRTRLTLIPVDRDPEGKMLLQKPFQSEEKVGSGLLRNFWNGYMFKIALKYGLIDEDGNSTGKPPQEPKDHTE